MLGISNVAITLMYMTQHGVNHFGDANDLNTAILLGAIFGILLLSVYSEDIAKWYKKRLQQRKERKTRKQGWIWLDKLLKKDNR